MAGSNETQKAAARRRGAKAPVDWQKRVEELERANAGLQIVVDHKSAQIEAMEKAAVADAERAREGRIQIRELEQKVKDRGGEVREARLMARTEYESRLRLEGYLEAVRHATGAPRFHFHGPTLRTDEYGFVPF